MMQLSLIAKMRGESLPVQLWIVLRLHPTSQNTSTRGPPIRQVFLPISNSQVTLRHLLASGDFSVACGDGIAPDAVRS
jgi:hypothetical protein